MPGVLELSFNQYSTVYNAISFALASMLATFVFLLVVMPRVLPRYRQALAVSSIVCLIAAYHYWRIFNSFTEAYVAEGAGEVAMAGSDPTYVLVNGEGFNEGYRYIDWLLTGARSHGASQPHDQADPGCIPDDRTRLPR